MNLDTPPASPKYFLPSYFDKILKNSASPIKFCPPDVHPNNERAVSFFSFEHSLVRLIFLPVHLGTRPHILRHLIEQHLLVSRLEYLVFILVTRVNNLLPLILSKRNLIKIQEQRTEYTLRNFLAILVFVSVEGVVLSKFV